jgi:two-component SAPR family response regulator
MPGKLLIYGNDSMLLTTRRLILEKVGYEVATVSTFSDAMLLVLNQQLDLLILCQSLNEEERRGMLESAYAINPQLKCAVLQFTGGHEKIANEETLEGLRGPTNLIESIRRMLNPGFTSAGSIGHATEAN